MTRRFDQSAEASPRRTFAFSKGFYQGRVRRILSLAGHAPQLGLPDARDCIAVWGASPYAWRGEAMARHSGARLLRVEDAFLRSVLPGRAAGTIAKRGPIGLLIDPLGVHFDPSHPSLIEDLVTSGKTATHHAQARAGITRLIATDLSKYNAHLPDIAAPTDGYVLVIDQTRSDASLMGAGRQAFTAMLAAARAENPGHSIVIRTHPETARGLRPGHFTKDDLRPGDIIDSSPISPWRLLAGAYRVYAISSQLGYEAMLAGHRPRLFGRPFYAGWGLSEDEGKTDRRGTAKIEDLFAASHLLAPVWYDPCGDRLTDFEGAVRQLEAEIKAWRQDHNGHLAYGMRLWKRGTMARVFGAAKGIRFTATPSNAVTLAWANQAAAVPQAIRVEDGFIRSKGLGAQLVPPLSVVADDLGIYYDPTRESRLERLIGEPISDRERTRTRALLDDLLARGITKYNLTGSIPALPAGRRILVPGQVQDDASIRLGAGTEVTNLDLLRRVRRDNPDAVILYKPHPDVEAGLRPGKIEQPDLALADIVLSNTPAAEAIAAADEIWTITSTLGFEALLRGKPVTVLGAPFYAGWGLTRDLGPIPARRLARPDLLHFAHAALIAYPRYFDPESGLPCPPEIAVERLAQGDIRHGRGLRYLAKLQGIFASQSWLWRR